MLACTVVSAPDLLPKMHIRLNWMDAGCSRTQHLGDSRSRKLQAWEAQPTKGNGCSLTRARSASWLECNAPRGQKHSFGRLTFFAYLSMSSRPCTFSTTSINAACGSLTLSEGSIEYSALGPEPRCSAELSSPP
eukprot:2892354-Pleurochrysis_carterae.AAC.2